jgi:hypothetical protein
VYTFRNGVLRTLSVIVNVLFVELHISLSFIFRYDMLTLLTMVNFEVSKQDISYGNGTCKQMPSPKYTLRKQLFFE